jgi:hypothetical protein
LIRPNYSGAFGARMDGSPCSARRQGHDGGFFSSPERRTVMLIPQIAQVGARTSSSGRREPAANPRRVPAAAATPAQVEPAEFDAGDDAAADDWGAAAQQQGMTLAGALAAYASY